MSINFTNFQLSNNSNCSYISNFENTTHKQSSFSRYGQSAKTKKNTHKIFHVTKDWIRKSHYKRTPDNFLNRKKICLHSPRPGKDDAFTWGFSSGVDVSSPYLKHSSPKKSVGYTTPIKNTNTNFAYLTPIKENNKTLFLESPIDPSKYSIDKRIISAFEKSEIRELKRVLTVFTKLSSLDRKYRESNKNHRVMFSGSLAMILHGISRHLTAPRHPNDFDFKITVWNGRPPKTEYDDAGYPIYKDNCLDALLSNIKYDTTGINTVVGTHYGTGKVIGTKSYTGDVFATQTLPDMILGLPLEPLDSLIRHKEAQSKYCVQFSVEGENQNSLKIDLEDSLKRAMILSDEKKKAEYNKVYDDLDFLYTIRNKK